MYMDLLHHKLKGILLQDFSVFPTKKVRYCKCQKTYVTSYFSAEWKANPVLHINHHHLLHKLLECTIDDYVSCAGLAYQLLQQHSWHSANPEKHNETLYKKKSNDTTYTVQTLASHPQNSQLKSKFNKIPKFHFVKWVIIQKKSTLPQQKVCWKIQ